MTDQTNTTEQTNSKPVPYMLSVLVDMSHEQFAGRGIGARVALHEVLAGLARTAALRGSDATVVQDANGKTLAVYMIAPDPSGEGKLAFEMAEKAILGGEGYREVAQETHEFRIPADG
jgi:hypothetical protein